MTQGHEHAVVSATVSGLPAGTEASLTVTISGRAHPRVSSHWHSAGCERTSGGYRCTARPGHATFSFDARHREATTWTFSVSVPSGFSDPSPGNNTASVQVPARPYGDRTG